LTKYFDSNFEHWKWEIPEDLLIQYGSPYSTTAEAFKALSSHLKINAVQITSEKHRIPEVAIIAGNEAYPESAISDPLSDLLVWYDWKTGRRGFPYTGQYAPLSLSGQKPKSVSTAAVGVIGEILTGLYSQSKIGFSPLARVINRWPDFIFTQSSKIHFIEAKASIDDLTAGKPIQHFGNHQKGLKEVLINAIQHLALEPQVTIWGGFVSIDVSNYEISFAVTFLEIVAPSTRAILAKNKISPIVSQEIAKRVLARKLVQQEADLHEPSEYLKTIPELDIGIAEEYTKVIIDDISKLSKRVSHSGRSEISRMDALKMKGIDQPLQVRKVGNEILVTVSISDEKTYDLKSVWEEKWTQIESIVPFRNHPFYRAGGSLFGMIPEQEASNYPKHI
jgi:hypothetical protein